jgi:hypothetical protein
LSASFSLSLVPWPSQISPYYAVRSTERFEDAPIRIVEFADPLCVDCRVLYMQLEDLKTEFAGKLNVVLQFFPLEARCNDVVEKDEHPGTGSNPHCRIPPFTPAFGVRSRPDQSTRKRTSSTRTECAPRRP